MTPRTWKLIAVAYLIKTILFGIAWLAIPDLPQRAAVKAREAWVSVAGKGRSAP